MKHARILIDGKPLRVDAAAYVRARDAHPKTDLHPTCLECSQRVYMNDEKGAKGFRLLNLEITKRGKRQKITGFSHHPKNENKDCSLYLANDPRFSSIHENNEFDVKERARNLEALNKVNMRQAIEDVQTFFIHRLTGRPQISADDKKHLANIERKLLSWKGLADHPWILGYIGPMLLGARKKQMKPGLTSIEYLAVGKQLLSVASLDGEERMMEIPQKIQLCYTPADGKQPESLKRGGTIPVEFEVSRNFAFKIAQTQAKARRKAREAAVKPPAPVQPQPLRRRKPKPVHPGQAKLF